MGAVARNARILEIGPSHAPLAPKSEGWNTATLDHANRDELVKKYTGHPGVDVCRIEEVDFVWSGGGPWCDAVPAERWGQFDVLIASHVIEHVPDFIGFFSSAQSVLAPDGLIILAVPDKRYCFDFFQPMTTVGEFLAAHAEKRVRHSPRLAYDYFAYTIADGVQIAFGHQKRGALRFIHSLAEAKEIFGNIVTRADYVDLHAWRFTPASFELSILELACLGELDWQIERITRPHGFEFYVWLKRGGATEVASMTPIEVSSERMRLLRECLMEVRLQTDCLVQE
jgi:SAM-dependent methyltransferase